MSDAATLRKPAAPSAKVWQPHDLLKLGAGEGGFVRTAWSSKAVPAFNVQTVKPWVPPEPAGGAELAKPALQSLPSPSADMAALDLEEEAPTEPDVSAEALKAAQDAAYAEGLAEGERRVREAWDADKKSQHGGSQALLLALDKAVRGVIQSPAQIHEPLKRLALHLAEQLVLAELTVSPQAIERLVQRAVDELAAPRQAPVLVELNPADLAMLKTGTAQADALAADKPWQLQANDALLPGSVKVSANDGVLVDLIENRLEALARSLLLEPARAMAQSAFTPSRMASRRASEQMVVDAQARMAPAWRGAASEPEPEPFEAETENEPEPFEAELEVTAAVNAELASETLRENIDVDVDVNANADADAGDQALNEERPSDV